MTEQKQQICFNAKKKKKRKEKEKEEQVQEVQGLERV